MTDDNIIRIRCRIPTDLWPYEGLEGTGQQQMIAALKELQELRNLKAVLLNIDENPAIALGKLLQAYESSNTVLSISPVNTSEIPDAPSVPENQSDSTEGDTEAIEEPLDQDEF